jgi:hypothetical protein
VLLEASDSVLSSQIEGLGFANLDDDQALMDELMPVLPDGREQGSLDEDAVLLQMLAPLLQDDEASRSISPPPPPSSRPPQPPSSSPPPPPPPSLPSPPPASSSARPSRATTTAAIPSSDDDAEDDDDEAELVIIGVAPCLTPRPEKHPYNGSTNYVSDDMYEDSTAEYEVFQILDRTVEPPHQAYLVAWHDDQHRFIGTWEWRHTLLQPGSPATLAAIEWIDAWKDKHAELTYAEYKQKYPLKYTALEDGQCFFAAVRLACFLLGDVSIVPEPVIETFIAKLSSMHSASAGVSKDDIGQFVNHM